MAESMMSGILFSPPVNDSNNDDPNTVYYDFSDVHGGTSSESSRSSSPEPKHNSSGGPILANPPSRRKYQRVIPATAFSPTYSSRYILEPSGNALLPLLKHVNCSYLSTPGLAPTLIQLKQHAQSLTILIKALSISTAPGIIDIASKPALQTDLRFAEGETYDWLSDLGKAYNGPSKNVNPALADRQGIPLSSILNTLEHFNATGPDTNTPAIGVRDHCPLHHAEKAPPNGPSLPYATHQSLISHANEVLELLDHEYSATGGLLSILPAEDKKDDRQKAEATLLGQLILYMQHLVERLHTLERQYANSLDIIASESAVPHQALSRLGPGGRKGRELVFPQDRFVLVNAGDDVWSFLDREFNRKERADKDVERMYESYGTLGSAIWEKRGGKEIARGITAIDVTTRYYRLRNDPLKTIFIIPAHQEHPGIKATREMEKAPTVVSVVKPVWPERASLWEMKHRKELEELKVLRKENSILKTKVDNLLEETKVLQYDNQVKDGVARELKSNLEAASTTGKGAGADSNLSSQFANIAAQKQEAQDLLEKATQQAEAATAQEHAAEDSYASFRREREEFYKEMRERKKAMQKEDKARAKRAAEVDKEVAQLAGDLEAKLKAVWAEQIRKTQTLAEWLQQKKVQYENDVPDESAQERARVEADRLVATALDTDAEL